MKQAEIRARFDEIVDFAGVERFLDTPVKRYSSGMYVRLAFAVAAHLEPEILVVDEVLAVGDAQFQNKCIGKMKDVAYGGRTVLIVSHYMPMVRSLCTRAIALSSGQVASDGTVEAAIGAYHGESSTSRPAGLLKDRTDRKGDGRLRFTDAYVVGAGGVRNACRMGEDVQFVLSFSTKEMIRNCDVSIHIENSWNQTVLRLATRETAVPFSNLKGDGYIICAIPTFRLLPGKYSVLIAASVPPSFEHLDFVSDAAVFEVVDDDVFGTGRIPEYGTFFSECSWDHRYA